MAKLIGTAGHVDHGKTTLIKALTGIDADRLPEEKKRGMTIDVGFAYLDLPVHGRVSIVDVPGHERFITNMLVGALGIDVALLCVAADEGVKPQTREHLQILELLPVDKLVVALTRADLADAETQELAGLEVSELIAQSRFKEAPILPVSAQTGQGIEELRGLLDLALGEAVKRPNSDGIWYLPIDRVFTVKGHGCVVTGTLARGQIKVGDQAFLEPGHVEVRVRGVQVHEASVPQSEAGQRTGVNLANVKEEDVRRGMSLGAAGALFTTRMIDAKIRWSVPVKHGQRVRVSLGAEEAIGKAFFSEHDQEVVQLRLETQVAAAMDQPLIIRHYSPPELLGGGRVVVPVARARRRKERAVVIEEEDLPTGILRVVADNPNGVPTDEVCRILGKSPQALGDSFELLAKQGRLRGFAGLWFSEQGFRAGSERYLAGLRQAHERQPNRASVARELGVQASGLTWAGKPLDRIIAALGAEGALQVFGSNVRAKDFTVQLPARQRQLLDRVKAALEAEVVNVPNPHDLSRNLGLPPQAVDEILKLGLQAGELVSLGEGVFYTPDQIERLKELVREAAKGQPFAASAIRDALGTTRKYVIPLLEHFDAIRFTARQGDNRVIQSR
jgi:selenocysteine-specific elongation factor